MNQAALAETQVADYRGCVVLIFSSDRMFLDYYCKMFLSLGFSPVTATTPQAAKGILRLAIIVYMVVDFDEGADQPRDHSLRAPDSEPCAGGGHEPEVG